MRENVDYRKVLEQFRTFYRNQYGVSLDDEILYFFIRVNQMQNDLGKRIERIPQIVFRTGFDYFLYGLGKWIMPLIILIIACIGVFLYKGFDKTTENTNSSIVIKDHRAYLEIKNDSAVYYLPIKTK